MEIIITILLGVVALLGYSVNANSNEVLKLKNFIREQDFEMEHLLDKKDSEIANLNRQLKTEKNKLLTSPDTNANEILNSSQEIFELQNEVQRLKNILIATQNENEQFKIKISKMERESKTNNFSNSSINDNEIYILRNKCYEQKNNIQNLNQILNGMKNENVELKKKIYELENGVLPGMFTSPPQSKEKSKKFVRVIFKGYSNKEHDYFLGNHKNIKVGDFVLVGTKNGAKQARVVYVSNSGEVSEYASSEIIKKIKQK